MRRPTHQADFRLRSSVTGLDTLQVVEELPRRWRRQLRLFTKEFIGESGNGDRTEILNPYRLEFEDEDGVFTAKAPEPLIIENLSLGYRITYILTRFIIDRQRGMIHIRGPFHFEEIESDDDQEKERWAEQRERTFQGSLQHLLWSLQRDVPFFQGFTVKIDKRYNAPYSRGRQSELFSSEDVQLFEPTDDEYMKRMRFSDYLYVEHRDDKSWIELSGYEAYVHESGYVYAPAHSPGSLIVHGDLSKRRVADLLPREYGMRPSMVAIGKGFPAGECAASRIVFSRTLDCLPQFGALVTNGQEELASLTYLVTMRWAEGNSDVTRAIGDDYQARLLELVRRHPQHLSGLEGSRHMASIRFQQMHKARKFVKHLVDGGLDISVQTYKADCPPVALTKLPLIAGHEAVEMVISRMSDALRYL